MRSTQTSHICFPIGPSGAGKTRGYVVPNLLQCDGSVVVTDTKGALRGRVGPVLERYGYKVVELNLTDPLTSPWGYNPLSYIRYDDRQACYSEQDILTVSAALTSIENGHEPFWDMSARTVIECKIGYVLNYLPDKEHNLCSVVQLFGEATNGNYDRLMKEVCHIAPDSFVANRYKMSQVGRTADKMYSSILGVLSEKLSPLAFDGTQALFYHTNQVDLRQLAKRKTAIF